MAGALQSMTNGIPESCGSGAVALDTCAQPNVMSAGHWIVGGVLSSNLILPQQALLVQGSMTL